MYVKMTTCYHEPTDVDGAYFGRSFAPFFMIIYPDLVPPQPTKTLTPTVFGYRLHKTCRASPGYKAIEDAPKKEGT